MFRNKEIKYIFYFTIIVTLLSVVTIKFTTIDSAFMVLLVAIVLFVTYLLATLYRYKEIKKLTKYLSEIQSSNTFVKLSDSNEGELSILKDEIYKVTRMLVEQKELLSSDKTFLSDALSDISHQLKTPLTSMMVMSDLLRDEHITKEKKEEFLNKISNQLVRIEWLLTALLNMAKLDSGKTKLVKEKVNTKKLIDSSVEHLRIPFELKNIDLIINGDDDQLIVCDFRWTREAIANIVKNCMEHTSSGGQVSISFSDNTLYTLIVISDNGEGIDEGDIPNIFERFYKGKNASQDSVGIGLAFAKQVISLERGTICVESKKDIGTKFIIKFYKGII